MIIIQLLLRGGNTEMEPHEDRHVDYSRAVIREIFQVPHQFGGGSHITVLMLVPLTQ